MEPTEYVVKCLLKNERSITKELNILNIGYAIWLGNIRNENGFFLTKKYCYITVYNLTYEELQKVGDIKGVIEVLDVKYFSTYKIPNFSPQ